jgi:hypothetical protein
MRPQRPEADPVLKLIHATMLGGTVAFFLVVFFLFRGEGDGGSTVLRWAWLAAAIGAVFFAGFLRGRLGPGADGGQVRSTGVMIWAVAEGVALLGMVTTIVTGDVSAAIGATVIGVFLMLYHRPSELD